MGLRNQESSENPTTLDPERPLENQGKPKPFGDAELPRFPRPKKRNAARFCPTGLGKPAPEAKITIESVIFAKNLSDGASKLPSS
jgi:hypothetical protein